MTAFAPTLPPPKCDLRRDPSTYLYFAALVRECPNVEAARLRYARETGKPCPFFDPDQAPPTISIDFETRSECDLGDCGAHVYAEHPTTRILCLGWAIGDDEPQVWTPGQDFPHALRLVIEAGYPVSAWNAEFEQVIWQHVAVPMGWPPIKPHQWRDAMARAAAAAFPQSLDKAGAALGASELKDNAGKLLIRKLCVPRRPTLDDWSTWNDDPALLAQLYTYCAQDIRAERAITALLPDLSRDEHQVWHAHSAIVHRGIYCDRDACHAALRMVGLAEADYRRQVAIVTEGMLDGDDIGSHAKLRDWLTARGYPLESVAKESVDAALAGELPADVRTVLTIRRALGRASTKKYQAMLDRCSRDGRIRGTLKYHGAHTGRWTGAGVQPQNLVKGDYTPEQVDQCFADMAALDLDSFRFLWGDPMQAAAWCLRGALCAAPGKVLVAADYTGIEARVLLWLAGDPGVELLRQGVDLYKEMAALVYRVAVADVTKAQRQLGKIAILGLGYGMGWRKFVETCAAWGITIDDELAQRTVEIYRERFAAVKALWYAIDAAAVNATAAPGIVTQVRDGLIRFKHAGGALRMRLPSGRLITYPYARVGPRMTPWGESRDAVSYMTVDQTTKQWVRTDTYGGSLVENAVQAISRDIMAHAMLRCEREGFPVVMTCHDEVCSEVPDVRGTDAELKRFIQILTTLPAWAEGCPITAEGFYGRRYRK